MPYTFMKREDLEILTLQTTRLVKAVGDHIQDRAKDGKDRKIELKEDQSYVTDLDKEAEKELVTGLQHLLPEAGFLTEEKTIEREGELYNWVIDPIDGTTNFVFGIPAYAISVGLQKGDEVVAGVIYELNLKECFYAWKGGGAHLNGEPLKVREDGDLEDALIATGFPHRSEGFEDIYLDLFKTFMRTTRGVRRIGSAAVDMAYVAAGRFNAFYEHRLHPWDVAAGSIIVTEAGGKVTDFKGGNDFLNGGQIIAACPAIYDEVMKEVSKRF